MSDQEFTKEQQNYLQGFTMGADVARAVRGLPVLSGSGNAEMIKIGEKLVGADSKGALPSGPEVIHYEAQQAVLSSGKKLAKEEQAKFDKNALDMWDEIQAHSREARFPKGTDGFLFKFHGLFYVSPAQEGYMTRLRLPGGQIKGFQFRAVADLASNYAGGYADITTRANLQLREIGPENGMNILTGFQDAGLINRGSGADNVRNITCNPTAGFDPQEMIDTLPFAKELHYHILNHRELFGMPRKFNIAFDGGGRISTLEDTNDIAFNAVRITVENATESTPAGIYFRLGLGGITGHEDFARDTGVLLRPEESTSVSDAILKVFIKNGDRTDRKKARLKYVLDAWGFDKFIAEVEKERGQEFLRFPLDKCEKPESIDPFGHVGVHAQSQPGMNYIGLVLPVGRMTPEQMHSIADIADEFGSGDIRLTVWQNLIIPNIADEAIDVVKERIEATGLDWNTTNIRSGLVACTGNAGCKFAASNTKAHAKQLADYLEERIELEQPINIHLTGCPHSCAQHYIGDIGLIGTKVDVGEDEDMVEGYHIFVGGGYGEKQKIGRELFPSQTFADVTVRVEQILSAFLEQRTDENESFSSFANRHSIEQLQEMCNSKELVNA